MDTAWDLSWKRFPYKPLDASRNTIRVLSLESFKPGDLRLILEEVSLDDWKPEYTIFRSECPASWDSERVNKEWHQKQSSGKQSDLASDKDGALDRFVWGDYIALSYRWGNFEETKDVTINGVPVTLIKSLALTSGYIASKGYKIWVDDISIHYENIAERNAHIKRIRDIYAQSQLTFVWLGPNEEYNEEDTDLTSPMERAFDDIFRCHLVLVGHDRQTLEAMLGVDVKTWESNHTHARLAFFPFDKELLYFDQSDDDKEFKRPHFRQFIATALLQLVRDPYWTRLWIIQELAVCSSFLVRWGDSHINSELLLTLAEIFCNKILDDGSLPPQLVSELSPKLHLINTIGQWRKSGVFQKREDGLEGAAFADLCGMARSAQCMLPQDKVYGLLGLLPRALSDQVTVDYEQDMATIQSAFTALVPAAQEIWATEDSSLADKPMYVVQDVPGKRKGLVATRKIAKGTRILSEKSILLYGPMGVQMLEACIRMQVEELSEDKRQAFLALHNIFPYKNDMEQYMGIIRTNGLPVDCDLFDGGIFLEACRINHACDNNAQKNWNNRIQRHTVQAMRDIDEGEEITISYLYPLKTRQERQKALQDKFGFACTCHLCSLPPAQSRESDRRLTEIRRLDEVIDSLSPLEGVLTDPQQSLRYFDQQVQLYQEQGREDVGFAQTLINAANLVIANGDLARGRVLEDWAATVWKTTIGEDTTQAMEQAALARKPSNGKTYGWASRWRTHVHEVPQGLEPSVFQDWLWKRKEPRDLEDLLMGDPFWKRGRMPTAFVQPADLRNTTTFFRFADLPNKEDKNADFYMGRNAETCQPRRHWCFLGEIVSIHSGKRLELRLKDAGGEIASLYFCTDKQGKEVEPIQLQKKYTVALLYASRHVFSPERLGIQHEDPRMIRIFPISLNHLLALNGRIQKFATETDGMKTCHRCGKKSADMKACSKCSLFWYCNKTCQRAGWKKKGHKADCGILQEPDLRGLFVFSWGTFLTQAQFPLRNA